MHGLRLVGANNRWSVLPEVCVSHSVVRLSDINRERAEQAQDVMSCCRATFPTFHRSISLVPFRVFSTTSIYAKKVERIPIRPTLPDHELHYVFLKGSGPGGQKIVRSTCAG